MGPTLDQTLQALTNHTICDPDATNAIERVRAAAKNLAVTIHREVPESPERTHALTQLRMSTMHAVQAIVIADANAMSDLTFTVEGVGEVTQLSL